MSLADINVTNGTGVADAVADVLLEEGNTTWPYGVTLCASGCLLAAIGLSLQKQTHKIREAKKLAWRESTEYDGQPLEMISVYVEPLWLFGLILFSINACCDSLAYGFAPQSLLAPVTTSTMVFNTLVAPIFLGEQLTSSDLIGTGIIIAGMILTVLCAEKQTPTYDMESIRDLYQRVVMIFYVFFLLCFLGFFHYMCWTLGEAKDTQENILKHWKNEKMQFLCTLCYPILGGLWGGHTILSAKIIVELMKTTFNGQNQLFYPEFWFAVCVLVTCLITQTKYLNGGLQRFDALFIVPVYQVIFMYTGIIGGGVFFDEFSAFGPMNFLIFAGGSVLVAGGVIFVAQRQKFVKVEKCLEEKRKSLAQIDPSKLAELEEAEEGEEKEV